MSQYIIYCRKSSESEERQILSIESQIKELKELAEKLKLSVSEILTESQSAKYPGRPVFNQMMKRVYQRQITGIICWKIDRLARNPIDGSALIWALDQGNIFEIATAQNTFRNNSNDKFLMQLEFGMAKKYVDDLSDNIKRGNRAKLEKGWFPGLPAIGYLNEPKERTIINDPERFPLIRKMWDQLLQGIRPSQILESANDEWGFRTRRLKKLGDKPLSSSGLYRIFGNPFYYGMIERREGVFIGKHERMITEEEYWRAQEVLGRKGRPRPKRHNFPLTGLIRCGECGCMITAEEKFNRYGYYYAYYRCTKKKRHVSCKQKYLDARDLEEQILEYLAKITIPERILKLALEYLRDEVQEDYKKTLDVKRSLEKAFGECQKKLTTLNRMRLNDMINDEEYIAEKRRLLDEKMNLEIVMKDKDAHERRAVELTEKTFIFASQAIKRFQNGSPEDKRTILQELGSNLFLRDKKLFIELEKPLIVLENGLGRGRDDFEPLEPPKNGLIERKNDLFLTEISRLSRLVEDVRTFFLEAMVDNKPVYSNHENFKETEPGM